MDFAKEVEQLRHISEVILYLRKYLDEHPTEYAPAMRVYITILHGTVPRIHTQCDGEECVVEATTPCGGITDVVSDLQEAFDTLDLELDFESPSFVYPADYSI